MRKFFVAVTVIALIISVVGTGVIVFIESRQAPVETSNETWTPSTTGTGQ